MVILTGIGETVMTDVMTVVGMLGGDKVKVVTLPLMVITVGIVCVTVTVFVKFIPTRAVAITLGVPTVMLVTRLGVGNEKAVFEPAGMVIVIPLSVIVVGLTTVTVTVFVKFVPVRVNGTTVGVPIGMLVTGLKTDVEREALEGVGKVIGIEVSVGAVGDITGRVMEARLVSVGNEIVAVGKLGVTGVGNVYTVCVITVVVTPSSRRLKRYV